MEGKKVWQSRTNWAALISAAAAFFPVVRDFISHNPEAYGVILSFVFAALRLITKEKIVIG